MLFIIVNNVLRVIVKRIGMKCDMYKLHTTSLFFLGEILCLLFYYTFYRVLFQSVDTWTVFVMLELLHLSLEWMSYPFRASKLFQYIIETIRKRGGYCGETIADVFCSKRIAAEDWCKFIALDFGIRVTIVVSSGIGISLLLILLTFVPWVNNSLAQSPSDLWLTIRWIMVAMSIELINCYIMNRLFFVPQGVSLFNMVKHAFTDDRFFFTAAIIVSIMFLNPVFAFTTDNVYHHKPITL